MRCLRRSATKSLLLGLVTLAGCLAPGRMETPPRLVDDPRVEAIRIREGDSAPYSGVLVNEWTWQQIIAALKQSQTIRR